MLKGVASDVAAGLHDDLAEGRAEVEWERGMNWMECGAELEWLDCKEMSGLEPAEQGEEVAKVKFGSRSIAFLQRLVMPESFEQDGLDDPMYWPSF